MTAAKTKAVVAYIASHQSALLHTDCMRELFMIPERLHATEALSATPDDQFVVASAAPLYHGKLCVHDRRFWAIHSWQRSDDRTTPVPRYRVTLVATDMVWDPNDTQPLCTPQDRFLLEAGVIANYTQPSPIETTIGRFYANYLFLVSPFGDIVAYINDEITASTLEKQIVVPLLDGRISARDVKSKYVNTMSLFGQSTDIMAPNITAKTLTIPKAISDLRQRLVSEHKDALAAGDVAVMSTIEKALIAAYKDYLNGDPSLHFLLKKKYFDVVLKKLFLTQGMTEVFGSPGQFSFVDNPMGDGWKTEDFATICNEVRQGSYARAIETANGGVIAKLILRVFQDNRITEDDCHTKRGETIHASKAALQDFVWNYVVTADGETLLTEHNLDQFADKDIMIRTPGYCQSAQGFCAKCFGRIFEVVGQKAFAPVAVDFARHITVSSLKSMHGKSHSTVDVSAINRYLI